MFTSHDGRFVYVSRPSFADVVGIEPEHRQDRLALPGGRATAPTTWRSRRTARALLVSASTAQQGPRAGHPDRAQDAASSLGRLAAREQLLARTARRSSTRASAASTRRPTGPTLDRPTQGRPRLPDRRRAQLAVLKRWDMGQKLDGAGYPDMSRPCGRWRSRRTRSCVYFQVSFFHGFVEFDLPQREGTAGRRAADERRGQGDAARGVPARLRAPRPGDEPEGTKLCVAGTMSDYAAIVDREHVRLQARRDTATSRTGRPTGSTETAGSRSAATTRSWSSTTQPTRVAGSRSAITRSACATASSRRPSRRSGQRSRCPRTTDTNPAPLPPLPPLGGAGIG